MDYADHRQLKLFLLLNDVDSDTGPFGFLGAHKSKQLAYQIGYKFTDERIRVPDDEFKKYFDWEDINLFCGSAGEMASRHFELFSLWITKSIKAASNANDTIRHTIRFFFTLQFFKRAKL